MKYKLNITFDGNIISSAEYDRNDWCSGCPNYCEEMKEECLKALKLHLLQEAYKDAERDLK